ncbi:MAG: cytochrome P450 [Pseudomonadota bacterium]
MIPSVGDVTLADMLRDPYPIYDRLRREAPVARLGATGRVLVTRHADCRSVRSDPQTFTSVDKGTPAEKAFRATTMMRRDGPPHAEERRAMQPALAARLVDRPWREAYRHHAALALEALRPGMSIDLLPLLGDWAGAGLAKVIGLEASGATMAAWSQALIDGAGNLADDPAVWARCEAANDAVDAAIDRAWPGPQGSMLAAMVEAGAELARVRCNIKVVIGGGINEPRDAAATAIFALLTNPDQLAKVREEGLWGAAFEEAIRWVAPIQTSPRRTTRAVTLGGVDLPAGTSLSLVQASANRDAAVWAEPDRFDVARGAKGHQAFSGGAHFCMGAHLSRMAVGEVLLPMLWERAPSLALPDPDAVPWYGFTFRGPTALQVTV